jgi:hypothetical protein
MMMSSSALDLLVFSLSFMFLLLFLTITPFIFAQLPIYAIQPTGCNLPIAPGEQFPLPTRNFYAETQDFTDLSLQQGWYFGPWYLFPSSKGICPWGPQTWNYLVTSTAVKVIAAISLQDDTPDAAIKSVKYCWRPKGGNAQVGSLTTEIFALLDSINAAANPPIASNMVEGYSTFRSVFFSMNTGTLLLSAVFFITVCLFCWTTMSSSYENWASKYKASCTLAFTAPLFLVATTVYWIVSLLGAQRAMYAGETTFAVAANWQAVWPQCTGVEVTSRDMTFTPSPGAATTHMFPLMMALVVTTPIFLVALWALWIKYSFFLTFDDREERAGIATVKNFYKYAPYAIMGWSTASLLREDGNAQPGANIGERNPITGTITSTTSIELHARTNDKNHDQSETTPYVFKKAVASPSRGADQTDIKIDVNALE